MQTGVMKYADPNGRPYTTPNGNFEGHNVTIEINGVPTPGQASCKQGNFPRMQALVDKRVVFEQEPGKQKQDGSFWPPTFKGLKDADAPDRGGFGGKSFKSDPEKNQHIFIQGIIQTWLSSSVKEGDPFPAADVDQAIEAMVKMYARHFAPAPERPGPQPEPATVGQSYAPQQPPAGGGYYDGDPGPESPF